MSGQSPTLLQQLAERLALPVELSDLAHARWHLLDWIGCAVAARESAPGRTLRKVAAGQGATLVGGGTASPMEAALINGGLGNVLEMDDVHRQAILHPGPVVVPAALAVAEVRDVDLNTVLAAIVRGYEAVIRIGQATGAGHYRFWHNTASCGPFGAAAAVAGLLELAHEEMVSALANAGSVAGGLWQMRHENVMTKQWHAGHAAQCGVQAALLAEAGMTGPASLLEGPQGFFAAMCPDGDADAVMHDAAAPWLLHEVSFKPWPACRHAHAAIDAALLCREEVGTRHIQSVTISTYADAVKFCDNPAPQTVGEAKFSLQHVVAVCLARGRPAFADFELAELDDAELQELRARCDVFEHAAFTEKFPAHYGTRVELKLEDGSVVSKEVADAWGDPENPIDEATLIGKARQMFEYGKLDAGTADALVETVMTAPGEMPVARLGELLGRPA